MTNLYSRNKPAGLRHRNKLRRWVLPRLEPGCRVPSATWLGRFLGIGPSEAFRHMKRALWEAGIATETRGTWGARRVYVVSIGGAGI